MPVDLNRIAEKLKKQRPMGVGQDGSLSVQDPNNDGSKESRQGRTTLQPKRFF